MKILFCHTGFATFVKTDFDILSQKYDVIPYHYKIARNRVMKVWNIFSSFFFALIWIWKVDVVYVWFGGYHGFFPVLFSKLLGKRSIVIVGGYDASYVPSLRYGVFYNKGLLLWVIKRIYQWATYICPVDENLVKSTNYYADPTGMGYPTGILNHMVLDEKKIKPIHLGFEDINYSGVFEKENIVLSVAIITNAETFSLKGYHHVFEVARQMPEIKFVTGNFSAELYDKLLEQKPDNMDLLPVMSYFELQKFYSRAKVIFQPSLTESFCAVLIEGMLQGCIPVASDVGSIKRSIGETGYVLGIQNVQEMKEAVISAMKHTGTFGQKARLRALDLYPINKRREKIYSIIES